MTDIAALVTAVEQELKSVFQGRSLIDSMRTGFGTTTKELKESIGALGIAHGFEIAGHGFGEGEWLYDLVWYKMNKGYLIRQALIMESELNPLPPVDGDFQKLVQARADIRVWVSCSPTTDLSTAQLANCKKQIAIFPGSQIGDTYIFVTDNWTSPSTSVERYIVERV